MLSTSDDAVGKRLGRAAAGRRTGGRRPSRRPSPRSVARPSRARWTDRPELWREITAAGRRLAIPAVALATGMVLLGLLVVHVLATGPIGLADVTVDRDLASHRFGTGNTVTAVLTAMASTPVIIALTAVVAVAFRLAYHRWRESVYLACCVAGETLIFLLTTLLVDRNRPPVAHLDVAPPTSDFPSGHTAAAVCCYGAIAAVLLLRYHRPLLRGAAVAAAVLLPLLVGASRLYRGMHFPTDVLAGLLLGASWLSVSTRRVLHNDEVAR
jgi:membrane-associated phospholipid phosphatase